MMIRFDGMERAVSVSPGSASVLEVSNTRYYARVCQSLSSGMGLDAVEPYEVWDDEGERMRPEDGPLVVADPFRLSWDDAKMLNALHSRVELLLHEDDEARAKVEAVNEDIRSWLLEVALQLHAECSFGVEWDIRRYLKTFGFAPEVVPGDSLIDNVTRFLSYAADVLDGRSVCFVGIKEFLAKNEVELLYERAFYLRIPLLLLEHRQDSAQYPYEMKIIVDQDFLEDQSSFRSECPFSSREKFASTVLEQ